nr:flocculation protein FLO11-like [Penaeus vannamei]
MCDHEPRPVDTRAICEQEAEVVEAADPWQEFYGDSLFLKRDWDLEDWRSYYDKMGLRPGHPSWVWTAWRNRSGTSSKSTRTSSTAWRSSSTENCTRARTDACRSSCVTSGTSPSWFSESSTSWWTAGPSRPSTRETGPSMSRR